MKVLQMGSKDGNHHVNPSSGRQKTLPDDTAGNNLREGIALLLSQWNGLQMAIENGWGGHDSHQKYQQLASDIFSWFSQSKARLHVHDLENLLHENMILCFNTDLEDGSIEEIAEELMVMHEEYSHGNR